MNDFFPYVVGALAVLMLVAFFFFIRKIKSRTSYKGKPASLLDKPKTGFIAPLKKLLTGSRAVEALIPELEELFLAGDVGIETTTALLDDLRQNAPKAEDAYSHLKQTILKLLTPAQSFEIGSQKPFVIFIVGVNGTGKTTSIGKLATLWTGQGRKVMVVAADTFRAAAGDQLEIWAKRSGADFVGGEPNADPASVVYNGIKAALARGTEIVLVDTAGRLHTKTSLMEELKKMVRVSAKELGRGPDEVWMVLDATTGQNGVNQVRVFKDAVALTGLVLTKYDGTSKGGVILPVTKETGLPIRFVGVGEGATHLKPFEPKEFVDDLFS